MFSLKERCNDEQDFRFDWKKEQLSTCYIKITGLMKCRYLQERTRALIVLVISALPKRQHNFVESEQSKRWKRNLCEEQRVEQQS